MRGKGRRWWPFVAVPLIVGAALWLLYAGWGSDHVRAYEGFAVSVVGVAAAWIAWVRRARSSPAGPAAADQNLGQVADLLAVAVKQQWEPEAGKRGLVAGEAIPVTWGAPSLRLAGRPAAAADSRRFEPLPGLALAAE